MLRLLRERSIESDYMPRNSSELKNRGGQFLCCPPTLKNGGRLPPSPTDRRMWAQPKLINVFHDRHLWFQAPNPLYKGPNSHEFDFTDFALVSMQLRKANY